MRAVFKVWPAVRIKVYVDDKKWHVHARKAEKATEAASRVYEELKKQMNMRRPKLSRGRKRRKGQGTVQEQIDDERHQELLY